MPHYDVRPCKNRIIWQHVITVRQSNSEFSSWQHARFH